MPTRKNEKLEPIRTILVKTDEIFVAKNRSSEPYIRSFVAAPENITQESLGTLVGVFSVSDHSESSGFVVNVLVSAVRKEYFANPRRGVIESFEAALHRMNLALAELVKNGQTGWIGNLHGSVAAIEKHSIHFSVTGSGRILLFRGDDLQDIGEGLASEEAAMHPLKTFVEISSGRLSPGDCLLLASPEIFDLFSDAELERSARRLVPERKFSRFLETAMTNELRQGAVIVLSAEENVEEPAATEKTTREPKKKPEKIRNVFSAETFKKAAEERAEIFREEPSVIVPTPEDIESRTRFGDIYVRGEEPENREEHPVITKLRWIIEDVMSFFRNLGRRAGEGIRQRKEAVSVAVSGSVTSSLLRARRSIGSIIPKRNAVGKPPVMAEPKPEIREEREEMPLREPERKFPEIRMPKIHVPDIPIDRMRLLLSGFILHTVAPLSKDVARVFGAAARISAKEAGNAFAFLKRSFLALSPKHQLIAASSAAFAITLGGVFAWNALMKDEAPPVPVIVTETPIPVFPPENERNAGLATPETLVSISEDIVAPVFMKDSLYLVTGESIYDTGSSTSIPIPQGGTIRYATGMDDLGLVFLMTEDGRLFAFAPSNRSFVENTLRLPSGFRPAGIGTFLTYLYVLEEGTGQVYRFPRAEGGFGDGLLWTREPMDTGTGTIGVSENIYAATASVVQAFFRGKAALGFTFEPPATPLSVTALCASEETPDRFAVVDRSAKRVIVYASDGHIVTQRFHESFEDASACSLSRDGNAVAVSINKDAVLVRLTE